MKKTSKNTATGMALGMCLWMKMEILNRHLKKRMSMFDLFPFVVVQQGLFGRKTSENK